MNNNNRVAWAAGVLGKEFPRRSLASGDWSISDAILVLLIIAETLIFIKRHAPNAGNSTMKMRMDKTLRSWVDVAYDEIKLDHINLTKRQLVAQILRQYEGRGDAMRCLDNHGIIAWKASPRFLTMLADAERDAQDELEEFP
jgi:hypothetical protein